MIDNPYDVRYGPNSPYPAEVWIHRVKDELNAQDEYDGYLGAIFGLLERSN